MKSDVSYIGIGAGDSSSAQAFLERLFGWNFHVMGPGHEGRFKTPSIKTRFPGNDPNPGIFFFLGVPDLHEAIAKVRELGGEVDEPSEDLGFGRFCTCRAPQGIRFALHRR